MPQCLDVELILSAVLDHLCSGRNRSELARLARVSRRFTDQALNVLWKENVPLFALLMILPDDLWQITPGDEGGWTLATFKVRRLVEPTDWIPRFEYYSSKIKHYDQRQEGLYIDPNVYKTFFSYTPFRHLLPNLKKITFWANSEDISSQNFRNSIPFFATLLNPNIESVCIRHVPEALNDFDFAVLLSTIIKQCPIVKKLELFGDCNAGKQPVIFRSFHALPCLQHLCFRQGSITSGIFTEASRLPGLLSLRVDLSRDDVNLDDGAHMAQNQIHLIDPSSEPFPQLCEVDVRTPNWGVAGSIVGYFVRPLQTLSIIGKGYCPYYHHGSTFTTLIGTITRNPHLSSSLRKLHIHGLSEMYEDPAFGEESVARALEGLFSLRSLEELSLVCCGIEKLTDAWLARASKFWPKMRVFSMGGNYNTPSDVKFTLGGIMPLVRRWKALDKINLSLIWSLFSPEEHISNRAVTSLTPGRGSYVRLGNIVGDCQEIMQDIHLFVLISALFILFPRLAHINLGKIEDVDRYWLVVQHAVAEVALESWSALN